LLNRIDDVIIFHPLTEEHLKSIVDLLMREVERRLAERDIKLDISDEAKAWLAHRGYDPCIRSPSLAPGHPEACGEPRFDKDTPGRVQGDTIGDTIAIGLQEMTT
jgi:hypothetical protein